MQVHFLVRTVALWYVSGNFWYPLLTEVVPVMSLTRAASMGSGWYKSFPCVGGIP